MPDTNNNSINSLRRRQNTSNNPAPASSNSQVNQTISQQSSSANQNLSNDSNNNSSDNFEEESVQTAKPLKKMIPGFTEICRIEGKVHGKFVNMSLKYGNVTDYAEDGIPKRIGEELYERKLEEFLNSEAGKEYEVPSELERVNAITTIKNYIVNTKEEQEKKRIEEEVQARIRLENEKRVAELYGHEEPKGDIPDDGFKEPPVNVDEYEEVEDSSRKKEPIIKNLFEKIGKKEETVFAENQSQKPEGTRETSQKNNAVQQNKTNPVIEPAQAPVQQPKQPGISKFDKLKSKFQKTTTQTMPSEQSPSMTAQSPAQVPLQHMNQTNRTSAQPESQTYAPRQQAQYSDQPEPQLKPRAGQVNAPVTPNNPQAYGQYNSNKEYNRAIPNQYPDADRHNGYADPEEIAKHIKFPKAWIAILVLLTLINIAATVAIGIFGANLREMSLSRLGMGEININGETYTVPLSELNIENGESKTVFYAVTSTNKDGEVKTEAYPIGEWIVSSEKVMPEN